MTFLAIRVGVREVPPLVLASMRFFIAGVVLYGWLRLKGTRLRRGATGLPRRFSQSASSSSITVYCSGPNTRASGVAAVMLATSRLYGAFGNHLFAYAAAHLPAGAGSSCRHRGVAVLVSRSVGLAEAPLIAAEPSRAHRRHQLVDCLGLDRKLPLPRQSYELRGANARGRNSARHRGRHVWRIPRISNSIVSRGAWFALAYLIVAGSIVGFTAYVWLIHHESPTKVGTYAYVNPS